MDFRPEHIVDVVGLIADGTVSNAGAKQALEASFARGSPSRTPSPVSV